jgi:dihydrofolate reductase
MKVRMMMRKLIVTMWVTLDGFISGPNDEMDWVLGDDEEMGNYEYGIVDRADTLVLGRKTYQDFSGYWSNVPNNPDASAWEVGYANRVNPLRKIVFSRTLEKAEWENTKVLKAIVPGEIEKLKQESGKNMVIYGSSTIIQALTNPGLIDEYQLLVHPVVLGEGKRLYEDWSKTKLKLMDTKKFGSGVVLLTYQPEKN